MNDFPDDPMPDPYMDADDGYPEPYPPPGFPNDILDAFERTVERAYNRDPIPKGFYDPLDDMLDRVEEDVGEQSVFPPGPPPQGEVEDAAPMEAPGSLPLSHGPTSQPPPPPPISDPAFVPLPPSHAVPSGRGSGAGITNNNCEITFCYLHDQFMSKKTCDDCPAREQIEAGEDGDPPLCRFELSGSTGSR